MHFLSSAYSDGFDQQRGKELLDSISSGFEQEGLGDLRRHVVTVQEQDENGDTDRYCEVREKFKQAASRTILPVFMIRSDKVWRPVSYEIDIAARIPWGEVDLKPVLSLTLSMYDSKDVEIGITLTDDKYRSIQTKGVRRLEESGIRVDPVFMTRQLCDIVPNAWQAHKFSKQVLAHFRENGNDRETNERLIANNFVFLIEELRKQLECEKDRLAEQVFQAMLKSDELRFLIIGNNFDWTLPKSIGVKPSARTLNRKDGSPLQLGLFTFTPEEEFNDTEKAVAWYLENQIRLFFWFRNRARHDYCIQGWRQHRIYPDFIFTSATKDAPTDYERVYVVETKGLHLKDNAKTDYIRKVFDICTKQAKSKKWHQLGPAMKDKIVRFEVLSEDEWEAKLNAILLE